MFQYNIKDYLNTKLKGNLREASGGEEITINSLFCPDSKYHLSVNSTTGLWICFKSGQKGNFTKLYAALEGISYREADKRISFDYIKSNLLDPQTKIKIDENVGTIDVLEEISPYEEINFCDHTKTIEFQEAFKLLYRRKLFSSDPISKFYFSKSEKYKNRLIIPFERNGKMFYFQARSLFGEKPKYLNCPRQKKSTLLYPYDPYRGPVLVCEGPLDALSLQIQGVNATAVMGSYVSTQQLILLAQTQKKIVLAFDSDKAGRSALIRTNEYRKLLRIPELSFCFPPEPYKDWNDAHAAELNLREYVNKNTRPLTWEEISFLQLEEKA